MTSKQKKDGQGDFRKSHQPNVITSTTTTTIRGEIRSLTPAFGLYLTLLIKLKGQDSRTIIHQQEWFLQFAEEDGDVIYVLLEVLHQHCAERRKWKGNASLLPLPGPSADGFHTARQRCRRLPIATQAEQKETLQAWPRFTRGMICWAL